MSSCFFCLKNNYSERESCRNLVIIDLLTKVVKLSQRSSIADGRLGSKYTSDFLSYKKVNIQGTEIFITCNGAFLQLIFQLNSKLV